MPPPSDPVEFRRQVEPRPDGRVRVTILCYRGGRLAGKVSQVRGGWQFRATKGTLGPVCRTAEEAKQAITTTWKEDQPNDMDAQA